MSCTHTHTLAGLHVTDRTHTYTNIHTRLLRVYFSDRTVHQRPVCVARTRETRTTHAMLCVQYKYNNKGKAIEGKVMIRVQYPLYPVALFLLFWSYFSGFSFNVLLHFRWCMCCARPAVDRYISHLSRRHQTKTPDVFHCNIHFFFPVLCRCFWWNKKEKRERLSISDSRLRIQTIIAFHLYIYMEREREIEKSVT